MLRLADFKTSINGGRHPMEDIWYTAMDKFDPSLGDEWIRYVEWAQLPQLTECISLDGTHRPHELTELIPSDWDHNVQRDYCISYFWDVEYVLERFAHRRQQVNILAILFDPPFEVRDLRPHARFTFQGYDLIDMYQISAITN